MNPRYYTGTDIVIKLKKLIKRIEQTYGDFDCSIMTKAQVRIIFPIIRDGHGYSMAELAELTGADKGLVSRTIADLESKEIVERDRAGDSNVKNYKIELSEYGKKFLQEKADIYLPRTVEWLGNFSESEIIAFIDMLSRLVED